MGNRAVFLDRDGTINEDVGYLADPEGFEFLPGVVEAIKFFNEAKFKVIVISNQSGVARGFFPEETVRNIDSKMRSELLARGALIDGVYFCPHHPEIGEHPYQVDCDCRKPKPGLLLQAAREHKIELSQSYVVGDRVSDIEAGFNAGCKTVLVLTGEGSKVLLNKDSWQVSPDHIVGDLYEAACLIVSASKGETFSRLKQT